MYARPERNGSANGYLAQQVLTASPAELVELSYLKALSSLAAASDDSDPAAINQHLTRAQDVLLDLRASLNHQSGGEVAGNLDRLYRWMIEQIVDANIRKTPGLPELADVTSHLGTLLQAWREAMSSADRSGVGAP